jgi:metal-responsive CopG/Arc/MetJ family transcriptional regulator
MPSYIRGRRRIAIEIEHELEVPLDKAVKYEERSVSSYLRRAVREKLARDGFIVESTHRKESAAA